MTASYRIAECGSAFSDRPVSMTFRMEVRLRRMSVRTGRSATGEYACVPVTGPTELCDSKSGIPVYGRDTDVMGVVRISGVDPKSLPGCRCHPHMELSPSLSQMNMSAYIGRYVILSCTSTLPELDRTKPRQESLTSMSLSIALCLL